MKFLKPIFFLALSIFLFQCDKDEGGVGPQGPQGLQGEIGPAGDDGSIIHADSGPPTAGLGKNGDFYLDKDTGELYGPKLEASGWGTPITLSGPAGANGGDGANGTDGADGSQIFAGTTAPAFTLGVSGDFYLNKNTFDLYGPKTGAGWGTPINLKGTANVMYSSWIEADWNLTNEARRKTMKISVNQLSNNDLRNKAVVLMYLKQFGTSSIYPMPSSGRWSNTLYSYTFGNNGVDFQQAILVTLVSTNGVDLTELQYTAFRGNDFRYVIIPGGVPVTGRVGRDDNTYDIDYSNYEMVKKYYGIRD